MPWDPDRYHQFQNERAAPFDDLLTLIEPKSGLRVADLGCGTGELTLRLADYLPESHVVGIDSSEAMLAKAKVFERPGLRFDLGRIEDFQGEWDLIFSHAALHWIDDHPTLIPRLYALLRPGGQLAVQMPSNHGHPAQTLILEIAAEPPFQDALGGWTRRSPLLGIDAYAGLLYDCGAEAITVFEKVYPHVLANAEALVEWGAGTVLVPYFERLPDALHRPFIDRYKQRLRERWPQGPVFYGFRRTLFVAARPV